MICVIYVVVWSSIIIFLRQNYLNVIKKFAKNKKNDIKNVVKPFTNNEIFK